MPVVPPNPKHDSPADPAHVARMDARREALRAEVQRLIPPDASIVWEIGCGHGHFLNAYAGEHPESICVGIDINLERVLRGERKRERAGHGHLHFLRAEAKLFLSVLPPALRFQAIYVLFPDPWPKKRHHKNRLLQEPFLHEVAGRCAAGTPLYFRTDYDPYFESVVETLAAHQDWHLRVDAPWPFDFATVFQERADSFQSLVAIRR